MISCHDCGEQAAGPVVHDEIWNLIGKTEKLCLLCMEERLGRKVHLVDLKECGENHALLVLWRRCRQGEETETSTRLKLIEAALDAYLLAKQAKEKGEPAERVARVLCEVFDRPHPAEGDSTQGT